MRLTTRRAAVLAIVVGGVATATAAFAGIAAKGPSSSHKPYSTPVHAAVDTISVLTVGDNVPGSDGDAEPGYQMVGIPDGLGAYDNGNGTFTLLMNHELRPTQGIVRAHGAVGAFVSKWTIDKKTFRVLHGEDLIKQVALAPGGVYAAPAKGVVLNRFCSADLAAESAFYNKQTGLGYDGRIYLNGEEAAPEGRAFAHTLDGTSYELPALGKMSWENALANPATGDKTVVVDMDDNSAAGEVYVYVGTKKSAGNPAERAGLTGGTLYGVRIPGLAQETDATVPAPARGSSLSASATSPRRPAHRSRPSRPPLASPSGSGPKTARGTPRAQRTSTGSLRRTTTCAAGCGGSGSTIRRARSSAERSTCSSRASRARR